MDNISCVKVLNSPANLSEKEAAVRLSEGEVFSGHSLKQLPAIQVLHDCYVHVKKLGCGVAHRVRHSSVTVRLSSVRVRRNSDSITSASCKAGPQFESRLGTPVEIFYRAEAMRISRVVLDE
jgi:hypothetical protein